MSPRRSPSPRSPYAVALGVLVALAVGLPRQTSAQSSIDAARAALEGSGLDDAQRQTALGHLSVAATQEREADALTERIAALRVETDEAPVRMEQLRRALEIDRDQALAEWSARLPRDADAETLEQILEQERRSAIDLRGQIEAVGDGLGRSLARPADAAEGMAALRRRIDEVSTPAVPQDGEPALVFEARRLRRAAEERRLQRDLELRITEQDTAATRQRQVELQLRELRHRLDLHESRIEVLQKRISDLGRRDLERLVERLAEQAEALTAGVPSSATAAKENHMLGRELFDGNEGLARERQTLAGFEQARERVQVALRDSRTRLELSGASEQVGRWLWSERRRVESPARLRQRLVEVRDGLVALRLRLVMLSEQQRALADITAAARTLREAESAGADDEGAEIDDAALEPLLRERRELLDLLEPLVQRRIATLEQSERALEAHLEGAAQLWQTLERRLLWIPSHAPIGRDWAARVPEGFYDLAKASRLVTTAELMARNLNERPARYLGSLLLVLALLIVRRRAPVHIEALAALTGQIRKGPFRHTLQALAWTLVAALTWPVALALFGWLLEGIGNAGRFSDSLGHAVVALAGPVLTFAFLRWSSIERGLGHAHFRWTRPRREALRRWLPLIAALVLPPYFVAWLALVRNQDLAIDVTARIAIVLAFGVGAWGLWRLLDVGRLWVIRGANTEPSTARRLLRVGLAGAMVASAILALAGYVYSAAVLLRATLATFGVVVAVATVLGLVGRWVLAGERQLKLRRGEEQRAAEAQPADESGEPKREPEAEITLEQVNVQTRRLLRALRLSLLAVGLAWVWADVLLAFARLDEIALWHFSDVGADGGVIQQPVTIMAALLGGVALALTVVAARNLPGLIEIGLQSRTRVDAASRYAITSVLRYAIVTTGTLIGLSLLGLRWSQLQWMAAALSVGLGFGLQEIFANFVSGLILLFERPFRVGDVITVADLSGRVTRIRTRATTVLDFDNKEIVIPNKTFITGQLINWTLSDTITRVTIKVGVAYGTDPSRVHALLLQAARENPRVFTDPEPCSWFLAFGASSLDFELRVFVGTLGDRLAVQNEVNTRIAELFAEHAIEISFPQLDVHVRDLPAAAPATRTRSSADAGGGPK